MPPSFLFQPRPVETLLVSSLAVEPRPRGPGLPPFPVRHEERVADEVARAEDADGARQDEE